MADYKISTTDDEDRAVEFIARSLPALPGVPARTPVDIVHSGVRLMLDGWLSRWRESIHRERESLLERASAQDRAAVAAILEKYRTREAASEVPIARRET